MDHFKISAKSFIVKDGKLLILKRASNDIHKPDVWEIPGGRLDYGEDPHNGVKRETREEAGIDIEVIHPLNIRHFTRDDGQIITMLIFLCKPLEEDIKISEEHSDFEWIPLNNCKNKLSSFFHKELDIFDKLELEKLL